MKGTQEKGITLIALVVTIIVLIILAGVSISLVLGDNGIITKAKEAKQNTELAKIEEEVQLKEVTDYVKNINNSTLDKTSEPIIWTINEETGEITGGGKILHIGDYVNYQEKVIEATDKQLKELNEQLNTYSGETNNALVNEELQWRILDVVDGQLRLISATPTTTSVIYLKGANGYNNAVYLIDNACNILYNSNYASKVQNLKIEDIQDHLTYDYTQYRNDINKKYEAVESISTSGLRFYPNIFAIEKTGVVNGIKGTKLDLSEQSKEDLITGRGNPSGSIRVTQTYWEKEMTTTDFKNPMYYTVFINNGINYSTYWMSSRCVNIRERSAYFHVRTVDSGKVCSKGMFSSVAADRSSNATFRPVIILKSNVQIVKGDGKTIETAYKINM